MKILRIFSVFYNTEYFLLLIINRIHLWILSSQKKKNSKYKNSDRVQCNLEKGYSELRFMFTDILQVNN
jgi:hypothetical protein